MTQRIVGLLSFLKDHETGVIETAAIITSSLRWIITFMPIDGVQFKLSRTLPVWEALSAVLSVAFAVVEVYATAFMMRAWNKATVKRDRWILGILWIASLVVMVVVQLPPLYANVMNVNINTLPQWVVIGWIIAVALSTFVIIAGVSYADTLYKQKTQPKTTVAKPPYQPIEKSPEEPPTPQNPQTEYPKQYAKMTDEEFSARMKSLNGGAPKSVEKAAEMFNLSHATAGRLLKKYREEVNNA